MSHCKYSHSRNSWVGNTGYWQAVLQKCKQSVTGNDSLIAGLITISRQRSKGRQVLNNSSGWIHGPEHVQEAEGSEEFI